MKKLLVLLILALVIVAAIVGVLLYRESVEVFLSQEELQSRVEEQFPVEERYATVVGVTLTDPEVTLREGSDRIQLGLHAQASVTGVGNVMDARGVISGTIRYVPREAAFFFDEFRIEALDTGDIPGSQEERVLEAVSVALRETLRRRPVYRLREDELRQAAARIVLRDVQVVDGRLRLRLSFRGEPPDEAS